MSNPDYKALYEALLAAHTAYIKATDARMTAIEDELYALRGKSGIRPDATWQPLPKVSWNPDGYLYAAPQAGGYVLAENPA